MPILANNFLAINFLIKEIEANDANNLCVICLTIFDALDDVVVIVFFKDFKRTIELIEAETVENDFAIFRLELTIEALETDNFRLADFTINADDDFDANRTRPKTRLIEDADELTAVIVRL